MKRCLHITINENPGAARRRAAGSQNGSYGTYGSDPQSQFIMPPIDDPQSQFIMPPIDDPQSQFIMPPIDDPSGRGSYGSGGNDGCGNVSVSSCCCGCGCGCGCGASASSTGKAQPNPYISPGDYSGFVIVRTAPEIDPNEPTLWDLAGPKKDPKAVQPQPPRLPGLKAVLELPFKDEKEVRHLTSRPLIELQGDRAFTFDRIRTLEKQTALTAFPPLHSLATYWRLDLRDEPEHVEEVVARLNELPEVDLAYRELVARDPGSAAGKVFAEDQGYLDDAPLGIGASWAWASLSGTTSRTITPQEVTKGETARAKQTGQLDDSLKPGGSSGSPFSMTICDLEQGWVSTHIDLTVNVPNKAAVWGVNRVGDDPSYPGHHGTAVLGQLAAAGTNPLSVKGAAAGLSQFLLASHYMAKNAPDTASTGTHPFAGTNGHVAASIVQALLKLAQGHLLLLEVQRGLLPAETDEADLDAIRLATGLGITVIEAAGNGGFDLDAYRDATTGRSLQKGASGFVDSGAVLVGASRASLPHDRAPFSNYGSRLDCFAWGEAVTTCGYGDLAGTLADNLYTNSFSGTSSASPIVTGAAALLQALQVQQTNLPFEPRALRALLSDPTTGTHQGPNVPGFIGVMPDLRAIVNGRLQLLPLVYMRRSVCDDGTVPGPGDEISSSPDLFFWKNPLNNRYDEGKGRENLPAPGEPYTPGAGTPLYVRLRNRGLGNGSAHVHIFASPAATLITPERWIPWGCLDAANLPQGDTLTVAAAPVNPLFTLAAPTSAPATPWSFLAILYPAGEHDHSVVNGFFDWSRGLPPSPPYFDWTAYRAFLRRSGVTIRNAHRVANPGQALPFFIAGVPDRARYFDFEVIQRLPAGTKVDLVAPPALDAKLRQRLPWTGSKPGALTLPASPRTAIRNVQLAAGTYAATTFTVTATTTAPLTASHSLAIRQLWKGEEVGRITWYFGLDI